jgi:hypothetical protein
MGDLLKLIWHRVDGELLKLGMDVGQTTVAKYMAKRRRPPSHHRIDRHVRGADDLVWASVWTSHPAAVTPRASVAGCDSQSDPFAYANNRDVT